MTLLARRIGARRLLKLVARLLKAGVLAGTLFRPTGLGPPHGALGSPLWANVSVHQLDLYWWQHDGGLPRKGKERRRTAQLGHGALIRDAGGWRLLTNGSQAEAHRLWDEIQRFVWDERRLELSVEKTHVTHINDGFDCLGVHVRRAVRQQDRPKVLTLPSQKAQTRVKATVPEMTDRKRFRDKPLRKFRARNAVWSGGISDDRHGHAKQTATDFDVWGNRRVLLWWQKRHRRLPRRVLARYQQRQDGQRDNWGLRNGEGWWFL